MISKDIAFTFIYLNMDSDDTDTYQDLGRSFYELASSHVLVCLSNIHIQQNFESFHLLSRIVMPILYRLLLALIIY